MSFWKRLFGLFGKRGSGPPDGDTRAAPRASATSPLKIDPRTITHAFVALTHADLSKSDALGTKVIDLNKDCEPRLWSTEIKAKCASFAVERGAARNGFPDLRGV